MNYVGNNHRALNRTGFTLIELLVVIAIIGLLASIVISSLTDARQRAQYVIAKVDIKNLSNLVEFAKGNKGTDLITITGSFCTECACRRPGNIPSRDLTNIDPTDSCVTSYYDVVEVLNQNTGGLLSIERPPLDPWGAPYLINENEGEYHGGALGTVCVKDNITSAGPNGLYYDSDDIHYNVPTISCDSPNVLRPNTNWD
jgi:prepilin-type N-terminal cleavage/methylation domain-containing protein